MSDVVSSGVVCARCGQAQPVFCTCRGCTDPVILCACDEVTEANVAREGCCEACFAAGCVEGLAGFTRCRRLTP